MDTKGANSISTSSPCFNRQYFPICQPSTVGFIVIYLMGFRAKVYMKESAINVNGSSPIQRPQHYEWNERRRREQWRKTGYNCNCGRDVITEDYDSTFNRFHNMCKHYDIDFTCRCIKFKHMYEL